MRKTQSQWSSVNLLARLPLDRQQFDGPAPTFEIKSVAEMSAENLSRTVGSSIGLTFELFTASAERANQLETGCTRAVRELL